MRLVLHGGFGEKGRTCMAVEAGGVRLLLDAGVKTSASGRPDY
jgi:predicted metal-dependent RNase